MSKVSLYASRTSRRIALPLVIAAVWVTASAAASAAPDNQAPAPAASQVRRDSMKVTIEPTKRIEVKLVMTKGQKADFEWSTDGAEVAFNLHGEVPTDPSVKAHVYHRGASKGEKGRVVAVFDGVHGWSWRNTGDKPVTVTVKASGQFSALKTM